MFLVNWFYDILASLGLYHKTAKILFLGLDNAGKTTLLHILKENRFQARYVQTLHPNTEELIVGQLNLKILDLDRRENSRPSTMARIFRDRRRRGLPRRCR